MKNLLGLIFTLLLLTGTAFAGPHDVELAKAKQLFVQIACNGPQHHGRVIIGTGFPVAEHMVQTARHVECGHFDALEISSDGHLWETIAPENNIPHGKYDMRVLLTYQTFKVPATFCDAELGEDAVSYGIADGNLMSVGTLVKVVV